MSQGDIKEGVQVSDFGLMIMRKFKERVPSEVPFWPTMYAQEQPINDDYIEKCALLEFRVKAISLAYLGVFSGNGLVSRTIATMKDPNDNIIWQKEFAYLSSDFNRGRSMEDFMAENGKLLREEMEFAAEQTVIDFIKHLKEKE